MAATAHDDEDEDDGKDESTTQGEREG